MSRVEFHPLADAELTATARFDESRAHGLGTDLLEAAERITNRLAQFPTLGAPLRGNAFEVCVRYRIHRHGFACAILDYREKLESLVLKREFGRCSEVENGIAHHAPIT